MTYETIHQWCRKFVQSYANDVRRCQPRHGDKWLLDEVFLKIGGKTRCLWRPINPHGNVLDIPVQSRRNKAAAKNSSASSGALRVKGCQYVPRVLITDKLGSYEAVKQEILRSVGTAVIGS